MYIYSGLIAILFCFYLTGLVLKILSQSTSESNTTKQNDSAGISYKLSYIQQIKVQILTVLSSKDQYLGLIYLENLTKNENVRKMSNQQL